MIENPTHVRLNSDDALTLASALHVAWRISQGRGPRGESIPSFLVREERAQ